MNTPRLSLIVPVYNVAPFLSACLESLSKLDPPADEIIVVDDGSTDDCPDILRNYQSSLPQMRIICQENGGLSVARNTGLSLARGTYVAFVDSDDLVEPGAYRDALHTADEDNLDMVLFNATYYFEGRKVDRPVYDDSTATEIMTGREMLRYRLTNGRLLHMVWMHLYRREFIENNGFRFVPRLIHEDVVWTTRALLATNRTRYLPHAAVKYRVPNRKFTSAALQTRLETVLESSVFNARFLADHLTAVADDPYLHRLMQYQMVDGALSIFHLLGKMPNQAYASWRLKRLRSEGFLGMLWRNAACVAHRRRIAKHWLRSFSQNSAYVK